MGTPNNAIRIAISAGDPFGIGPEVSLAACEALRDESIEITLYGDPAHLPGIDPHRLVPVPLGEEAAPTRPAPSAAGGEASLRALKRALDDIEAGRQDALVTAPISKESWALAGKDADGHTPYLGRRFGATPLMTFAWDRAEPVVALLTTHIPLRAVPATLTSEKVEHAMVQLHDALCNRLGHTKPRLAVLGLNPHAGENGLLGTEELDFVAPAVERLRERGFSVAGPLPGDSAFAHRDRYDGILALFHDQGLAPVKALAFRTAVNITLGLPIVRTSPSHGTAFDIAGSGRAEPTSMIAAVRWAALLARGPGDASAVPG